MKYVYTLTMIDDDDNQIITTHHVDASDARTAHNIASANNPDDAIIRVYPDTTTDAGLLRGAVMVARRTAVNAIQRQGTPTQVRVEREYAAINARLVGAETADRINAIMADSSADAQDMCSVCRVALVAARDAGLGIAEQYRAAYLELNQYLHAQRAASAHEVSTEYILSGGGDIVAINTAMSAIIKGGDKWTPTDGGTMDAVTAARLGTVLHDALALVSPTQRQIAALLGQGYSQRQIADKMGRSATTVNRNIALMRDKVAEYIRSNVPDLAHLVDSAATTAAAATTNIKGGKKDAAYYRAYRARKAAAKARK